MKRVPKRKEVPSMKRMAYRLQPWKYDVMVLVGGSELEAWAEVTRYLHLEELAVKPSGAVGRTWTPLEQPVAIWVRSLRPADWPVLAHEVWHAVSHVLRSRGVKLSEDSEEGFCYTADDLLRAVLGCRAWEAVKEPVIR